jgi:energy-coupling factor transport system substrate-specific component
MTAPGDDEEDAMAIYQATGPMRPGTTITSVALALIPVGIAINYVGKSLAQAVSFPLFVDSIGTILAAALAGPWVGAITGLFTNLIYGVTIRPTAAPYGIVNAAFGLVVGYAAYRGWFKSVWHAAGVGVVLAFVGTILSAPITVYLFGGIAGSGDQWLVAYFMATGNSILASVLKTSFIVEPIDKVVSAVVAYYVTQALPIGLKERFGETAA